MWDKIKKFAADAKVKAADLADKGLKAAPDLAKKAAVGIRDSEEFDAALKGNKRFAAVFGQRTDMAFQKILVKMPYYLTLAFISTTKVKTVEFDEFTDFAKSQGVTVSPTVLYFKQQQLVSRHEGAEAAEKFLAALNTII